MKRNLGLLLCLLPLPVGGAEVVKYAHPGLLLEPADLAQPDVARQFVILDARSRADYTTEHIPGALWVDVEGWSKAFADGQDAKGWGERIGALGIGAAAKVVAYDDKGLRDAARIWWILRYWGVGEARLLNGGWNQWQAEKRPVTGAESRPRPVPFTANAHAERLATRSQILDSLAGRTLQIVDARSEKEFCGIDKGKNQRGGAIPGSRHLEWSDLIDKNTNRFKSAEDLRRLFAAAGIDLNRPTATYCQSGGRASVMVFALELIGADHVRNYYRSWGEWGNTAATPIEVRGEKGGK